MNAITLASGEAEGRPLRLDDPLSFWGGLDVATGLVIDRRHPQAGESVAGRVLMMSAGRGSSSGSAALAEALRLGVGPAAILLLKRDGIVIVGALVAAELYRLACPVALVSPADWETIAASAWAHVTAEPERTEIALYAAAPRELHKTAR